VETSDDGLREAAKRINDLWGTIAVTAVAAERELGLVMFDAQLQGALALADGIVQMQTGGQNLAAVPAVIWYAKQGRWVHVITANDYLAPRDAQWMGGIPVFWIVYRVHSTNDGIGRTEAHLRVRRHLQHGERSRLRMPPRSAGTLSRRPGASALRGRACR